MSNTATTAKDAKTAEWNTLTDLLGDLLVEINDLLGLRSRYSLDDTREQGLTFGYLGNVEFGEDDRSWYVFLPTPAVSVPPRIVWAGSPPATPRPWSTSTAAWRRSRTVLSWPPATPSSDSPPGPGSPRAPGPDRLPDLTNPIPRGNHDRATPAP